MDVHIPDMYAGQTIVSTCSTINSGLEGTYEIQCNSTSGTNTIPVDTFICTRKICPSGRIVFFYDQYDTIIEIITTELKNNDTATLNCPVGRYGIYIFCYVINSVRI